MIRLSFVMISKNHYWFQKHIITLKLLIVLLSLVYAADGNSSTITESVKDLPVVNIFSVHKKIEAVLSVQFPDAIVHHATSLQLDKSTGNDATFLYGIFYHNCIKVLLFDGTSLKVVQQFNYNTPVDAAYHLLNCCHQYNFQPAEISLVLSGMIDEQSKLYNELYKCTIL